MPSGGQGRSRKFAPSGFYFLILSSWVELLFSKQGTMESKEPSSPECLLGKGPSLRSG